MTDNRIRNLLDKYERFREINKKNFDTEFGNNLLDSLNTLFILPELERRKKDGKVNESYYPDELLIRIIEKEPVISRGNRNNVLVSPEEDMI